MCFPKSQTIPFSICFSFLCQVAEDGFPNVSSWRIFSWQNRVWQLWSNRSVLSAQLFCYLSVFKRQPQKESAASHQWQDSRKSLCPVKKHLQHVTPWKTTRWMCWSAVPHWKQRSASCIGKAAFMSKPHLPMHSTVTDDHECYISLWWISAEKGRPQISGNVVKTLQLPEMGNKVSCCSHWHVPACLSQVSMWCGLRKTLVVLVHFRFAPQERLTCFSWFHLQSAAIKQRDGNTMVGWGWRNQMAPVEFSLLTCCQGAERLNTWIVSSGHWVHSVCFKISVFDCLAEDLSDCHVKRSS